MQKLVVGRIAGAFGIQGWLRVHSFTDPPRNIGDYRHWYIESNKGWQLLHTHQRKWQGDRLLVHIKGCDDRDQAQAFKQRKIAIDNSELPALAADEFYWHQLQDLRVLTVDGLFLGRVEKLLETGANDVLVVHGCEGSIDESERLIPWLIPQVVSTVDIGSGEILVNWDPTF